MLINLIDFKKLWKIMKSYGIPQRIIEIIKNFYDSSRCAVRHGGEVGEGFLIITAVYYVDLVTVDLCPGGGLGDDESYECKGYWNQMGQWRQAGRPRLCR